MCSGASPGIRLCSSGAACEGGRTARVVSFARATGQPSQGAYLLLLVVEVLECGVAEARLSVVYWRSVCDELVDAVENGEDPRDGLRARGNQLAPDTLEICSQEELGSLDWAPTAQ